MPEIVRSPKGIRVAIIYLKMVHSVGGIATHLNMLRRAAIELGDSCDILVSDSQKSKHPGLFPERKWISGGDTKIWVDGELPHHPDNAAESIEWLDTNYDAIIFSKIAQHKTTAYPEPHFLSLYKSKLPKVALQPDGYWDMIREWGEQCIKHLRHIYPVVESYKAGLPPEALRKCTVCSQPFLPTESSRVARSKEPLLIWPNQWKDIKGIKPFLEIVPQLPKEVQVELYSCGLRYYQLRTDPVWQAAVGKDLFKGFDGKGRATYFGNVDLPVAINAMQRAWFTVNLQGMRSRKESYKRGSYNYTEVEALYYGACPILHKSTEQTILPKDCYITIDNASQIPNAVDEGFEFAIDPERQRRARIFVREVHDGHERYKQIRKALL